MGKIVLYLVELGGGYIYCVNEFSPGNLDSKVYTNTVRLKQNRGTNIKIGYPGVGEHSGR